MASTVQHQFNHNTFHQWGQLPREVKEAVLVQLDSQELAKFVQCSKYSHKIAQDILDYRYLMENAGIKNFSDWYMNYIKESSGFEFVPGSQFEGLAESIIREQLEPLNRSFDQLRECIGKSSHSIPQKAKFLKIYFQQALRMAFKKPPFNENELIFYFTFLIKDPEFYETYSRFTFATIDLLELYQTVKDLNPHEVWPSLAELRTKYSDEILKLSLHMELTLRDSIQDSGMGIIKYSYLMRYTFEEASKCNLIQGSNCGGLDYAFIHRGKADDFGCFFAGLVRYHKEYFSGEPASGVLQNLVGAVQGVYRSCEIL